MTGRTPAGSPRSRRGRSWSCACSGSPPWSGTRSRTSSPGSWSRSRIHRILQNRDRLRAVLREELVVTREKFADKRRTVLGEAEFEHDVEDLIQREEMVVTLSHRGYVKRVPLSTYRAQRRGGKGRAGMSTRDEDFVSQVFVVNTHTPVLFFSTAGKVYSSSLPSASGRTPGTRQGAGQPAAAGGRRDHFDHPAHAGRRGRMGEAPAHVRDRRRLGAAQQRERLRERAVCRQDRDEARHRKTASSAC